ncbi:UxaA family hydrolase [Candidatus Bathyarchaeota archaeon]|nr:UxaA family hydrolase [Candidatus Bathyarchaeota archaeon]
MKGRVVYGYERPKAMGVRNHVLILPTVICSTKTALRIAESVKECKVAVHPFGCGQAGEDLEITYRTLRNTARNPNVASVLIVSLGCEKIPSSKLVNEISEIGKRVELLTIQDVGGTPNAIKRGVEIAKKLVKEASQIRRRAFDMRELLVGVECGGSDWTSGISANPAAGQAMDMLIDRGARVVFSETPEIIGAEHILMKRARTQKVRKELTKVIGNIEERFEKLGIPARETNPSRGNIAGGITTLEEKALGAIYKAGTKALEGVLCYSEEIPRRAGLFFMDTPGHDVESVTGMVAGGAQIVVFTTGLGTPTGNPIAPVIKITGNPDTYRRFRDNIDLSVGTVIQSREKLEKASKRIYEKILSVASGERTRAEVLGHDEFSILKAYSSF